MIQVSPAAAEHIRYLKQRDKVAPDMPLRVSVKEGGCSGFSYKLDFESGQASKTDKTFQSNGVSLVLRGGACSI